MAPPDSRYFVHASTQAAHAQQEYLREESEPRNARRSRSGAAAFNLRTDWWIPLAILALIGAMALLVIFVR